VLRYGGLYGPGTSLDGPGSEHFEAIRKRLFPLIGDGAGVWSFIHIEDAAEATVAALERGRRGIYNVVDDEPTRVADWMPALARAIGAKPPRRVPRWLGRLLVGEAVYDHDDRGAWRPPTPRPSVSSAGSPRHPSMPRAFAEGAV
jgi:nucleoside-diphosphate-sugar epimerase